MRTLIVDDSKLASASLVKALSRVDPEASCELAYTARQAFEIMADESFDVVFLDIEMPGINGLEVARRLRRHSPKTNVVFVTGYPEYALDAWRTGASGFMLKPITAEGVREQLSQLRYPFLTGDTGT
jgi:DNA-binding LytR/AlgR family response regulator